MRIITLNQRVKHCKVKGNVAAIAVHEEDALCSLYTSIIERAFVQWRSGVAWKSSFSLTVILLYVFVKYHNSLASKIMEH